MTLDHRLTQQDYISRRDAINASMRANRQLELRVALYAYRQEAFILCATTGISEAGTPVKIPYKAEDELLGRSALELLLQTYKHPAPSHKEFKLADWPAFVASGAKTGRAFEENSVYVRIETRNMAVTVRASRRKPQSSIYIGEDHSLAPQIEDFGTSIRRTVALVRLLDSQNAL